MNISNQQEYKNVKNIITKKGKIKDFFSSEDKEFQIKFEGMNLEFKAIHFQKVLYYLIFGIVVELEIDLEENEILSIKSKDPEIKVVPMQEHIYMRELKKTDKTRDSALECFNKADSIYSDLVRGTYEENKYDNNQAQK